MADKETKTVETKVEQVDVNLDDIFNAAPGGDSITLPEENTKPNIFSRKGNLDTSFLDPQVKETTETETEVKEEEQEEVKEEAEVKEETPVAETTKEEVNKVLDTLDEDEGETPIKKGRKKIEGIGDVFDKLIKDEKIIPFDDEKS